MSKHELDRWLLLASNMQEGTSYIRDNFKIVHAGWNRVDDFIIAPWFDPTDIFMIRIATNEQGVRGHTYHELIDIRAPYKLTDNPSDSVIMAYHLTSLANRLLNVRDYRTSIHPHPEPNRMEAYDDPHLWRNWISPDAFECVGDYDYYRLPHEPEWLASAFGIRRRRRQSLWARSITTLGDQRHRPLDDVSTLEGIQQRSKSSGSTLPSDLSQSRDHEDSSKLSSSMGSSDATSQITNGSKRSNHSWF